MVRCCSRSDPSLRNNKFNSATSPAGHSHNCHINASENYRRSLGNCPTAGEERSERKLDDEDQLDPFESSLLRRTLRDREILGGTQRRYSVSLFLIFCTFRAISKAESQ